MVVFSLARAKARLSRSLKMAEADEEVVVAERGPASGRILSAACATQKLPLDELAAFRATMPSLRRASVELLREAPEDGL